MSHLSSLSVQKDQECHYREDARRSGRITKAEVCALKNEISTLRQLVQHNRTQPPSPQSLDVPISVQTIGGPTPPSSLERFEVSPSYDARPVSQRESYARASPRDGGSQPTDRCRRPSSNAYGPVSISPKDPEMGDQHMKGPSPTEVSIAGAVSENGRVHVHGVTSILHHFPETTDGREDLLEDEHQDKLRDESFTDRLISYAAIQRQQEYSVLSGLRVENNIELDGVPPALAKHLLDLHWNRQHLAYLLTYRPAVMDSLSNGGPHANKLMLNAIYYSSCLYSDRSSLHLDLDDPNSMGSRFYRRFKELLVEEIDRPSIPTAVALLLCGASVASHGRQSAGWVLCGIGYRMIIDLGCHLSIDSYADHGTTTARSTVIESEIRRRVYWGAFLTDKFQSLYLGRAPALRPAEARVPKNLWDSYEELESWTPYRDPEAEPLDQGVSTYQPRPAYAVSTFRALIGLAEIATRVIDAFYSIESIKHPREVVVQTKLNLEGELDEWNSNLPPHLRFDPDTCPTPPPHQALGESRCATAALNIWGLVKAYKTAFTLKRAPFLLSYATYSAVLVILHQTREARSKFSESIPFFWSALLDLQRGCNAGLKKPLKILKELMRRLGEDMPPMALEDKETRASNLGHGRPDGASEGDVSMGDYREGMLNLDVLQNLEPDLWNNQSWLDSIAGDQGWLDDSIYGLFTAE
ncbi:MAG: hypothetical protein M4579_005635 [Chaenotheca gracillima]|nr:MAG: hypothetical protein M4579_005635 [Chaenotheca gracillima]